MVDGKSFSSPFPGISEIKRGKGKAASSAVSYGCHVAELVPHLRVRRAVPEKSGRRVS